MDRMVKARLRTPWPPEFEKRRPLRAVGRDGGKEIFGDRLQKRRSLVEGFANVLVPRAAIAVPKGARRDRNKVFIPSRARGDKNSTHGGPRSCDHTHHEDQTVRLARRPHHSDVVAASAALNSRSTPSISSTPRCR